MKNKSVKKLSSSELSYFCTQVAMILKSGMLIPDGIDWMYNDIEEGNVKNVLGILRDELSNKVPLYVAMENSGYFPSYIINMSQIGNVTGRLEDVMSSLSEYYDRESFIKSKVRNSIFYPTMLFIMMSFVIILIVTKIFPIFEGMIEELGGQLSNESSFMMSFSSGIMAGNFTLIFVLALFLILVLIYIISRTKNGKAALYKFLGNFVLTKSIMKKITSYRFASGMSLLLSSGMNVESSINMLLEIVEEPELKNKIEQCSKSLSSGKDFLESVSKLSLFSSMHLQMLNMGQRIGEMDVVMKKLTDIYESEADQSINNAVSAASTFLIINSPVFVFVTVLLAAVNCPSVMLNSTGVASSQ